MLVKIEHNEKNDKDSKNIEKYIEEKKKKKFAEYNIDILHYIPFCKLYHLPCTEPEYVLNLSSAVILIFCFHNLLSYKFGEQGGNFFFRLILVFATYVIYKIREYGAK